ncbi:unnamed protein product, partial [Prorocentrum cordatum]
MRARGPRWPFPRGAWFDGRSNGELLGSVGLAAGDHLEVKVRDYEGRAQGRELLRVEIAYALGETTADAGSAGGRYLRAQHVGATDGHFSWHAQAEGKPGGRPQGTLYHLCGCPQEECTAGCPIGAGGVEHIDIWRVVDPCDLETLEAECHLAPRAAGGLRVESSGCPTPGASQAGSGDEGAARHAGMPPAPLPPLPEPPPPVTEGADGGEGEPAAKRARKEEPSAALGGAAALGGSPLDAEVAGLGRALEDPALGGRLAQLGQRLRGGTGGGSGARAVVKNAAMPGAARALAQRVQEHAAAGSGARVSAALAGRERLVAMLTAALLGGKDGSELSGEGSGVLDRDTYRGVNVRRDLLQQIAKQRPGALLENGLAHLRSQFTQLLADPSQADPLGPCVTQYLNTVFFVAHPPRTLDAGEVRVLRTLGEVIDGLLRGQVVEVSDLFMQEFKARTMALRDGHWRSARWLTLIPSESLPAGAPRDEEAAAERAEAREMKVAELKRRKAPDPGSDARGGLCCGAADPGEPRPSGSQQGSPSKAEDCPTLGARISKEEQRQQVEDEELLQAAGAAQPGPRKLLASAGGPGGRPRFELVMMFYEAVHGAPGDVGRFVRSAPPVQRARRARMREVLPLPIPDAPGFMRCRAEWLDHGTVPETGLDAAIAKGWAVLVVHSLNHQCAGHAKGSPVPTGPLTAAQESSMRVIRKAAKYFATDSAKDFQVPDWHEVAAARDITYGGEEVTRALPLTLGGVMPGLPPRGVAASVRALDIADERVAGWLADPTLALLPKAEWPEEVPRAAIQASSKAEWHRIGAKQVELGLAVPIADDRIFKRLIINMVPANSYQRTMRDDIGTLSASPSWVSIPLPEGHVLLWSSDDQASAFYCCELPEAWQPYMTLAEAIPNELIGVNGAGKTHIALRVIPMGWINVQAEQRAAYKRSGIRVAEGKAKHRELVLERMGAGLNGMVGRVGVTVEKQLLLLALVMWVMGQPQVTVKAMLVVLGRCVRVAEFRRPFMGFLSESFTGLRAKIDMGVIAADASEQAGGICYSAGLTARGVQAATGEGGLCEEAVHTTFAAPQMMRWRPRVTFVELLSGAAAAAVAAHRLPMSVAAHLCSEVEPAARRLVRRRWPGVIELGNIEALDLERFTRMLEGFRRDADWFFIAAGSPRQDLSTLNVVGKGLEGDRSKLLCKVPALIEASKRVFGTRVDWFVENVFSMGAEARGQFSQALGVAPVLLEAKDFTRVRRSRLFWCSCPACCHLPHGTSIVVKSEGISQYTKVEVSVERAAADLWPLPGWRLDDPVVGLPCFTRPVPRRHPPLRPVGLERASPAALARWAADKHRYQVNNYEDAVLLWSADRAQGRPPVAEERGVPMGFDRRYFEAAVKDSVPSAERDIIMECLVGNTLCIQCVMFLFGSWLAQIGALSAPLPAELCLQVGERGPNWNIDADFKTPGYRHATAERGLIVDFLRIADRGGTGVRLDCGAPCRARAWPRSALRTSLWAWRVAKSFRWQRPAHISELELEAAVAGARWRCRDVAKHGCRYLHLLDAQAVAAVCTKCRSSAWRLQPGFGRLNALTLATNCNPMCGCCDTDDMPADVPSRWTGARSGQGPCELAVTPLARKRYQEAVDSAFDWWVEQKREVQSAVQTDVGLVDYIEGRWAAGGSLLDVNCAIAGMCHHFPPLRGRLRGSWCLACTWQRAEPAGRSLPIAPLIALAFSGGFLAAAFPAAAILLAAYDTCLRTGEIMALRWHDIIIYENSGSAMTRLRDTKSQHQTGAGEFVMVRSQTAVALLLKARELAGTASRREEPAIGMPPAAFQRVFAEIRSRLQLEDQRPTLYSWRRGGASADFRFHGSMETALLRGRWASVRAARLRIQGAVAEAT